MGDKMKLYKKSQEVGRSTILMIIVLLVVLIVMAVIIYQSKDIMLAWFYKINFFA